MEITNRIWHKRLALASLTTIRHKSALCAYNAHLDAVVHFNQQAFAALFNAWGVNDEKPIIRKSKREIRRVDSPQIFLAAILQAFSTGKAMMLYANPHVTEWLIENFGKAATYRVGGQAGIIANQLANLNASPVLYAHHLSKQFTRYLNPRITIPTITQTGVKLTPGRDIVSTDKTKVNWVFEYHKGDMITFANQTFTAPRSNRVILATECPPLAGFDDELAHHLPELGEKLSAAFMAGYHSLEPIDAQGVSFEHYLDKEALYLQMLKAHNPNILVHVEFIPAKYEKIEKWIYEHLENHIDSLGINEIELVELTDKLGFSKLARELAKKEDSIATYKAAHAVMETLHLKRIHVHNLGYSLIIISDDSKLDARKQRTASLFSSLVATARAEKGMEITRSEVANALNVHLSPDGLNQLHLLAVFLKKNEFTNTGIAKLKNHTVILTPTQHSHQVKTTVGLGDTISSTALLAGI